MTVLTSYDDADLAAAGYELTVPRARRGARRPGSRYRCGWSCLFGRGGPQLRDIVGTGCAGYARVFGRPAAATGDQKRIMTPARL